MTKPPEEPPNEGVTRERRQFEILNCLGVGGFGEVYLANMTGFGGVTSAVALKVLHRGMDPASQAVERLRDEGRMLGMLNHPAILQIHDLVLLDGRVALVTEYVAGADLDHCFTGPDAMPERVVLESIGLIAAALDAAYNTESIDGTPLRLVHRDIKPSNIRVGQHGEVKLLDFGIAKATGLDREAKTSTNTVIGSFKYMAPERFDDEAGGSTRSDVYSLGCTLFEAYTGDRLYVDMTVKQQYLYALDEVRHDEYVAQRLATIERISEEALALLQSLLAFEEGERPDVDEVSARCDELVDRLEGPSLRRWARSRTWEPPAPVRGDLDGLVISEHTLAGPYTASGERRWPTSSGTAERVLAVARTESVERPWPATPVNPDPNSTDPSLYSALAQVPDARGSQSGHSIALVFAGVVGGLGVLGIAVVVALLVLQHGILSGGVDVGSEAEADPPVAPVPAQVVEAIERPDDASVGEDLDPTTPSTPPVGGGAPRRNTTASVPSSPPREFEVAIEATGDATSLEIYSGGKTYPMPGMAPVGSYTVKASFATGSDWEKCCLVVTEEDPVTIHCKLSFSMCTW